jgi:ABC-type multidrug transport system fused ATPase/permease subunit
MCHETDVFTVFSTGAGKSSIMVALFRLVELVSGSISVDGVNISRIGLNDVRNAVSIIPQDATLCT